MLSGNNFNVGDRYFRLRSQQWQPTFISGWAAVMYVLGYKICPIGLKSCPPISGISSALLGKMYMRLQQIRNLHMNR